MVAANELSFRLRGIPDDWTEGDIYKLLEAEFDNRTATIRSLAPDPTRNRNANATQAATVNFGELPKLLEERGSRNSIKIRDNTYIEVDDEFEGFTPLHSTPDDSCDIDIIAISGLNGHAFGSFKGKGQDAMWLRDFLPKDLPRCRIFIYGYKTRETSFQTPTDIAKTFKHELSSLRKKSRPRPWVVIGHSLGGVVAKIAIKDMAVSEIQEEYDTYTFLRGVLFFGVPSDGMKIESLRPLFKEEAQRSLLESIDVSRTGFLRQVHGEYMRALGKLADCMSFYFYETLLSPTLVRTKKEFVFGFEWKWESNGPPEELVSDYSATSGKLYEDDPKHRVFAVNSDHSNLVKFSSENHNVYKTVVDCLEDVVRETGKFDQKDHNLTSGENRFTKVERACLKALAFPSMDWIKRDPRISVHKNAFEWFFKHATVDEWITNRQRVLWILGYAESGKTALMHFATKHLREKAKRSSIVADFFVNGRSESISKRPVRIYRSLLHQLLQYLPGHSKSLATLFQDYEEFRGEYGKKWKWTEEDLQDCILEILETVCSSSGNQKVFLFVDGIDNMEREHSERFIRAFNHFLSKRRDGQLNLSICFSCRYSPNLRDGGLAISMDSENTQDIRHMVEDDPVMSRLSRHGRELQELIVERAQGCFSWASKALKLVAELHERGKRYKTIIDKVKLQPRMVENEREKAIAMNRMDATFEEDSEDDSEDGRWERPGEDDEGETSDLESPYAPVSLFLSKPTKVTQSTLVPGRRQF